MVELPEKLRNNLASCPRREKRNNSRERQRAHEIKKVQQWTNRHSYHTRNLDRLYFTVLVKIMTIREPREVWWRTRSWYHGTLGSICRKMRNQDSPCLHITKAECDSLLTSLWMLALNEESWLSIRRIISTIYIWLDVLLGALYSVSSNGINCLFIQTESKILNSNWRGKKLYLAMQEQLETG